MYYPATFTPMGKEMYDVTFIDLPGCTSQGKNLEDALRMASEALTLHLDGIQKDSELLPKPSSLEEAKIKDEAESKAKGLPLVHGTIYQFVLVNQSKTTEENNEILTLISAMKALVLIIKIGGVENLAFGAKEHDHLTFGIACLQILHGAEALLDKWDNRTRIDYDKKIFRKS